MKKILFSVFALASMLFATSCSQEEDFAPVTDGTEVEVYFSAQLPQEISTRAYSDGTTANKLHYAVYAKESDKTLFTGVVDIQGKKANVPLILANGMTYDLIFWAQSNNATAYSLDWDAQTMTVDYNALKANDENNDAFYKFIEFTVDGTTNKKEVVLTRPFAQINLGTSDFAAAATAGFVPDRSNLVISTTLPNVLNFVDGSVSGKVENATFAVNAFAKNKEEFPVEPTKYEYLEMSYVLVNAKELIDCTFNVWKEGEENSTITPIVVSNVPVQRNHRTNIYGALLTNPTEFEITIEESFDTPDYNADDFEEIANGVLYNSKTQTYLISSVEGMQWFAGQVNSGVSFESATVELASNIDMKEVENWPTIGDTFAHSFNGTFNGNNHTISNLAVTNADNAGLFGHVNGTLKNVTLENVAVAGNFKAGALAASVYGTIDNCHVNGGTITSTTRNNDDANNVGGLVGYLAEGNNVVKNSSAKNVTVTAYRDVAGLVGTAQSGSQVIDNTVEDVAVVANQLVVYNEVKDANAGEVVGRNINATAENNTANNVTINVMAINNKVARIPAGRFSFPELIEEGVTFEGEKGSVLICNSNQKIATDNITLKNLTIEGPGASVGIPASITITGDNVTIDGCDFINSSAINTVNGVWCSDIRIEGGKKTIIKNCTFDKTISSRVIMINVKDSEIYIENCTIDRCIYPITTQLATGTKLYVKDSWMSGWTSYNTLAEASFENCTFEAGNSAYHFIRVYCPTTFTKCKFQKDCLYNNTIYTGGVINNYGSLAFETHLNGCTYLDNTTITKTIFDLEDWNNNSSCFIDGEKVIF